jgi:hypothetical protein
MGGGAAAAAPGHVGLVLALLAFLALPTKGSILLCLDSL